MNNYCIIPLVAAGGALGAVYRYFVGIAATKILGHGYPYGTFIVNILGSFLMGVFIAYTVKFLPTSMESRSFVTIGFLGAFTTFSAFSLELVNMIERGQIFNASVYASASVLLSISALFCGLFLIRNII